ncbi:MAG: peptide chain release factor 3, partial [Deltaproteobacteria bacterium]
ARWVQGATGCAELEARRIPLAVTDIDGHPVALLQSEWDVRRLERDNESWKFLETAPIGSGFAKTDA